jgi:dGTPase
MEATIKSAVTHLREFMFKHVYLADSRIRERRKINHVISELYEHYMQAKPDEIMEFISSHRLDDEHYELSVCDYIAGMTDGYALRKFGEIFLPHYRRN